MELPRWLIAVVVVAVLVAAFSLLVPGGGEVLASAVASLATPDVIMEILVFIVIVLSLNMEYGWTGIPNFGKVAFVSLGGLAAMISLEFIIVPSLASMAGHLPPDLNKHAVAVAEALKKGVAPASYEYVSMFVNHVVPLLQAFPHYYILWLLSAMALAVVFGLGFALLTSYSVVRLREDYLAITLLMGAFLLWVVYMNVPQLMGGTFGVTLPIEDMIAGVVGEEYETVFRIAVLLAAAITSFIVAELLLNTPLGRVLRAVRDDEVAAEAMGKNVARVRLNVLLASSVWAALGGVLYVAVYVGSLHPDFFKPEMTFWWIAMMLLGGVGNNVGAVVGVLAFELVFRVVSGITGSLVGSGFQGAILNFMVGLIIILVMFLRPRGLVPEKAVATPIWRVYEERIGPKPEYAIPWWEFRRKLAALLGRAQRGKRSSRVG